jgi:hypothetical protein
LPDCRQELNSKKNPVFLNRIFFCPKIGEEKWQIVQYIKEFF